MSNSIDLLVGRALLRIRPAPLASALKRLLCLRRRELATPGGVFWVDPASVFGQELARQGVHDSGVEHALRELLSSGDTFVDVGANEGYFSVVAATQVGSKGRIIAVEPQTRLGEVLRRNFALNRCENITTVVAAISDQPGTAELRLTPDMNNGATGFAPAARYRLPTQPIRCLTLEGLLAEQQVVGPIVLKMDIEGWEHEAILGSRELFRSGRVRALVLELHPQLLVARGLDPEALPKFLRECGYVQPQEFQGYAWVRPDRTPMRKR